MASPPVIEFSTFLIFVIIKDLLYAILCVSLDDLFSNSLINGVLFFFYINI